MSRHQSGGGARGRALFPVSTKKYIPLLRKNAKFGKASIDSFRIDCSRNGRFSARSLVASARSASRSRGKNRPEREGLGAPGLGGRRRPPAKLRGLDVSRGLVRHGASSGGSAGRGRHARVRPRGGRGRDASSRRQRSGKRVGLPLRVPAGTWSRARRGRGVGESVGRPPTRGRLGRRDGFGGWRRRTRARRTRPERSPARAPRAGSVARAAASSAPKRGRREVPLARRETEAARARA